MLRLLRLLGLGCLRSGLLGEAAWLLHLLESLLLLEASLLLLESLLRLCLLESLLPLLEPSLLDLLEASLLRLGLLGKEAIDLGVSEALLPQLVHKLLVLVLRLGKAACNKTYIGNVFLMIIILIFQYFRFVEMHIAVKALLFRMISAHKHGLQQLLLL